MGAWALREGWSVAGPGQAGSTAERPRLLRDTAEALALRHGGSILVGGSEDVNRYWNAVIPPPAFFASEEDFFDSFKEPLRNYTGGGRSQRDYGINIVDIYQFDYLPAQPAAIFN